MAEWSGQPCIIVASGPSALDVPLDRARGLARFIAVNSSWRLCPWADMLMACDEVWWDDNHGASEFKGKKFTASPRAAKKWGIGLFASLGCNSGIRAIYLAERLGASPIVLVGFDMHCKRGPHWHEPHKTRNPGPAEMRVWVEDMRRIATRLLLRVDIINCTPDSALKCFRSLPFEEVMQLNKVAAA